MAGQTSLAKRDEGQLASFAPNGVMEATAVSREVASIQGAIFMAKQFPRNPERAREKIMKMCDVQSLAIRSMYAYSRTGTGEITGPSIHLAKSMAQAWGNIQYGIRELEQREGESVVEAFSWDLESNTKASRVFTVPHVLHTKTYDKKLDDPRSIYEMVANNGSRRLRACILDVLPPDIVEEAVEHCKATQNAMVTITPDTLKKLLDAFAELGVTKAMIEAKINHKYESITPVQIINMRSYYESITNGEQSVGDFFDLSIGEGQQTLNTNDKATKKDDTAIETPEQKESEKEPKQQGMFDDGGL